MNHLFPVLTALAYLLSFGLYVRFLGTGSKLTGRLGSVLLGLGLIAHYFALLERSRGLHTVPYHDLYGSMSLFGWLLGVTYLGLELYHRQRRSEEHTSELQSLTNLVCRLLLEKKNK